MTDKLIMTTEQRDQFPDSPRPRPRPQLRAGSARLPRAAWDGGRARVDRRRRVFRA